MSPPKIGRLNTRFRKVDKRYEGRFTIGKRRYSVYGDSKQECVNKYLRLTGQAMFGVWQEPHDVMAMEYLDAWLLEKEKHLRLSTLHIYRRAINKVRQDLGETRLVEVTPQQISFIYARQKGRIVGQIDEALRAALNDAVRVGVLFQTPMRAIRKPKRPPPTFRVFTHEEVRAILEAAEGDRLEALYVVAFTTGMREGELFALTWADVSLRSGTLSVNKAASEVCGKISIDAPKTAGSRRTINLTQLALDALKRIPVRIDAGPIFSAAEGGYMYKSRFLRSYWRKLLVKAKVSYSRFHDVRHTVATHLLQSGEPVENVAKLLGHANVRTTYMTYGHVMPGAGKALASKIDAMFGRGHVGSGVK